MDNSTTPERTPSPAGIISQPQFDAYAAAWLAANSDPAGTVLAQSFQLPESRRLLASLSFPVLQIARLVSTTGVRQIKARFLIVFDEVTKLPHFTLALFAVDALDTRVSSYYIADEYWKPRTQPIAPLVEEAETVAPRREKAPFTSKNEVPDVLANYWRQTWAAITRATPPLFANNYGPLQGYTFELNDFILPLRQLWRFNQEKLLVEFALHEYYNSEPKGSDMLVKNFGLMLSLQGDNNQIFDGLVVNMGAPCPPSC